MDAINCLIVDDEEIDRMMVEDLVLDHPSLHLVESFSNAIESLETLKSKDIELLFLDIDMPVISGVDFLKKLSTPPLCIFITSHVDYALDAFDLHAVDYLLKPVKKERFDLSIKRAIELISIRKKALNYDLNFENDRLTIKEGNSINKVAINDIIYLEALTNYTKVVTGERNYITLQNLKNFLEELPQDKFLRVHRSYAVAKNKITSAKDGELKVGSASIPLGKTYKKMISKLLSEG
jgi:DNA-binding LytR/AlgR family response regulator